MYLMAVAFNQGQFFSRGYLAMSVNIFDCLKLGWGDATGIAPEVGEGAKHPKMSIADDKTKNYLVQMPIVLRLVPWLTGCM